MAKARKPMAGSHNEADAVAKQLMATRPLPARPAPFLNLVICDKVYGGESNQHVVSGTFNLLNVGLPPNHSVENGLPIPPLYFYFKLQAFKPKVYTIVIASRVISVNGVLDGRYTPVIGFQLSILPSNELAGDGGHVMPPTTLERRGRSLLTNAENRATIQIEGWVDGKLANAQRATISWYPAKGTDSNEDSRSIHDVPKQR